MTITRMPPPWSARLPVARLSVEQTQQIRSVARLDERLGALAQFVVGQESHPPSDLFRRADLQALTRFDGAYEAGGVGEGIEGAGVEPGRPARQNFHLQLARLEVDAVDVGDFVLAAGGRLELLGDADDVVVVEVQARDREIGLRLGGLFLDGDGGEVFVELDDAVGPRI